MDCPISNSTSSLETAGFCLSKKVNKSSRIEIMNLSKYYPGGVQALNDITVTIQPGEMISLIGQSGAGKTTLLRCLNGLIRPTYGKIVSGGLDITKLKGRALRNFQSSVGMIFQQFNLVKRLDVFSNVMIGCLPHKKGMDLWLAALGRFHLAEKDEAYQSLAQVGILDYLWRRTDSLSGGQQQRVAIAKILMQHPSLILADEPIASLDSYSSITVMELLRDINQKYGATIIMNMHYLDFAKQYSSRILGLKKGKLVFDGSPEQLTPALEKQIYENETSAGGQERKDHQGRLPRLMVNAN